MKKYNMTTFIEEQKEFNMRGDETLRDFTLRIDKTLETFNDEIKNNIFVFERKNGNIENIIFVKNAVITTKDSRMLFEIEIKYLDTFKYLTSGYKSCEYVLTDSLEASPKKSLVETIYEDINWCDEDAYTLKHIQECELEHYYEKIMQVKKRNLLNEIRGF